MKRFALVFSAISALLIALFVVAYTADAQEATPEPVLMICLPNDLPLLTPEPIKLYSSASSEVYYATYQVVSYSRSESSCEIEGQITVFRENGEKMSPSETSSFSLVYNLDGFKYVTFHDATIFLEQFGIAATSAISVTYGLQMETDWFSITIVELGDTQLKVNTPTVAFKFDRLPPSEFNRPTNQT